MEVDEGFRATQLVEKACYAVQSAWGFPKDYSWEDALKKMREALAAVEKVTNG